MKRHDLTWRFLATGKGSAMFNMGLDEALFESLIEGVSPQTLRVFSWWPYAVTCGYAQRPESVLDIELCVADGIDVASRPTGGRAVYHGCEVAYSLIAAVDDSRFGGSIMETYERVSRVLCKALGMLGVDAVMSPGRPHPGKSARTSLCFLSTSRYELTVDGKKLVGSAQRRSKGFFLQQGSIPIDDSYLKIVNYLIERDNSFENRQALVERSTFLDNLTSEPLDDCIVGEAIRKAFNDALDGHLDEGEITDSEKQKLCKMLDDRNTLNRL